MIFDPISNAQSQNAQCFDKVNNNFKKYIKKLKQTTIKPKFEMPFANFKCVREVSSEDAHFPAENLVKQTPGKKWKTKAVGEKSAHCIFELNKPLRIVGIDIGNEHSAFVEVLVSNSACRAEDFKEILITCSFMTPFESKSSTNPNRVRCFNQEALVSNIAKEKWHLIKVICTQPFNKHCQYGLSFIKINVAEDETTKQSNSPKNLVPEKFLFRKNLANTKGQLSEQKPKTIANFTLREDSPDSESESSAALFSRWKKTRNGVDNQPTAAAAIRQASTNVGLIKLSQSIGQLPSVNNQGRENAREDSKGLDRNRDELAFGDDNEIEDEKSQRLSRHIETEKQRLQIEKDDKTKKKDAKKESSLVKHTEKREKEKSEKEQKTPSGISKKRRSSSSDNAKQQPKKPKTSTQLQYRPFNKLLQGVVLVISGIQNPDRADLRGKALAMGAKYKADWEPGCTHLICAFKNTPKYNQVKGKGKIVLRSWIEKCFTLKKYLPWRRYALDSDEQSEPESDTEVLDEALKPSIAVLSDGSDEEQNIKNQSKATFSAKKSNESRKSIEQKSFRIDSGSDTDDYIEDIQKKNFDNENKVIAKERDIYDMTTEEEDFAKMKSKPTPNFFHKLSFLISDDLKSAIKHQLVKCIEHYGGSITPEIKQADIIVADEFQNTEPKFSGEIVNPNWIFECNDMEQKIDMKPHLVLKNK